MSGYSVQVFVDEDTFPAGHVALKLTNNTGQETVVGYYPATDGTISLENLLHHVLGPGVVKDDSKRLGEMEGHSATMEVSEQQYLDMMDYINTVKSDASSTYYLGGNALGGENLGMNCATFADNVLEAGNISYLDIEVRPYEYLPYSVAEKNILDKMLDLSQALTDLLNNIGDGVLGLGKALLDLVIPDANGGEINDPVNGAFNNAFGWFQKKDPLTLDLDGDGLETIGINPAAPILFDHDGDGIANATGWIKPDDGFLVLDRNGDGVINDGTELFGDSTPLYDANGEVIGQAADGFAALAAEDSNHDGFVNAQDAHWADLRVWQDADSDGVTDEGELHALESLGIAGFQVAKTENTTVLSNGNQIADLGKFIRTDGSSGTMGNVTGGMADIDLAHNPFYRTFTDTIPLTDEAKGLPDMQGSGAVRDLREASSLSSDLAATLADYAVADTKAEQLALVDGVIAQWAASAEFETSVERAAGLGITLIYHAPGGADVSDWVGILETFNGAPFLQVQAGGARTGAGGWVAAKPVTNAEDGEIVGYTLDFMLSSAQYTFLSQAYAALSQSVYDGLLTQTRLKPYLDAVSLTLGETGLGFDMSGTGTVFQARFDTAPAEAVRDLLDMQRIAGTGMTSLGWDGYGQLRGWLATASNDAALESALLPALSEFGYPNLRTDGAGTAGNDVVIGADGGAVLNGNAGNDLLLGGEGDDTLNGGTGNDILYGGAGNDTYVFNLGDGVDTVVETDGKLGTDILRFGTGVLAGDLDIYMDGDKLIFAHVNGKDRLSIANWFNSLTDAEHRLDTLTFANGSTVDLSTLQLGTSGADTLTGTDANDLLVGGAGDDVLYSEAGDDLLIGGTGIDTLAGGTGNDTYVVDSGLDMVVESADEGIDTIEARASYTLQDNVENLTLVGTASISGTGNQLDNVITGNTGNNALYGLAGNDTLIGGAGNDLLDGGSGADIMAGGTGDDAYVVDALDDTVTELAGQGIDTVYTGLTYTLGQNLENLTLTGNEAVTGTGNELNNVLTGNAADNTLFGMAGDDILNGGEGADTMLGGTGNDTYVVESAGDIVIENVAEGNDTVQSSITYTLTDNVENLTLTGTENLDGTGGQRTDRQRCRQYASWAGGQRHPRWSRRGRYPDRRHRKRYLCGRQRRRCRDRTGRGRHRHRPVLHCLHPGGQRREPHPHRMGFG